MRSRWKIRLFALLTVATLLLPMAACAKSRGREELITVNLDEVAQPDFEDKHYFQARWIQVTATVEGPVDVTLHVVLDDNHTRDGADKIVYKRTTKKVNGAYKSPEIFLKYLGSRIEAYRVDLLVGGEVIKSGNIHRMLLNLKGNTVCLRGLRFRDVDSDLTDKWYSFRPINLNALDGETEFDLIGSNMYLVGRLVIRRDGDEIYFYIKSYDELKLNDSEEYEADAHEAEHRVTDHAFNFTDVRIGVYRNWNAIKDVSRSAIPRTLKLGKWYDLRKLGGTRVILYLNGKISYNPNGLPKVGATQNSGSLSSLLQSFAF